MNHKQGKNANMEENLIIEKALENLAKQTGITATWRQQGGNVDGTCAPAWQTLRAEKTAKKSDGRG